MSRHLGQGEIFFPRNQTTSTYCSIAQACQIRSRTSEFLNLRFYTCGCFKKLRKKITIFDIPRPWPHAWDHGKLTKLNQAHQAQRMCGSGWPFWLLSKRALKAKTGWAATCRYNTAFCVCAIILLCYGSITNAANPQQTARVQTIPGGIHDDFIHFVPRAPGFSSARK